MSNYLTTSVIRVGYAKVERIYYWKQNGNSNAYLECIRASNVKKGRNEGVSFNPFDERTHYIIIPIAWVNDVIGCFSYQGRYFAMESLIETSKTVSYI